MNYMLKVSKQFPKTAFLHATGYKMGKNMGIYNARFYQGRYVAGVIAGEMTKSNKLGYVAAFPIPEVLQGINAFIKGARSVNPKATLSVIWVNSWYDPGKEREAAMTLISQGADIVTHHTDSTAVVQAAEEKGVYAIGYHSDMSKYGPKAHLTAVTHHWGDYYTKVVEQVLAGTFAVVHGRVFFPALNSHHASLSVRLGRAAAALAAPDCRRGLDRRILLFRHARLFPAPAGPRQRPSARGVR